MKPSRAITEAESSIVANCATAIIYLTLHLAFEAHAHSFRSPLSVTAWYPPLGLSLAYLLCCGRTRWPVVLLGYYLGIEWIWSTGSGVIDTLRIAASNTLAAYVGTYVLQSRPNLQEATWTLSDLRTLIFAGILSGIVSGILILGYWRLIGIPLAQDFPTAFAEWLLGDLIGILLVTPLMLIAVAPLMKSGRHGGIAGAAARILERIVPEPARWVELLLFLMLTSGLMFWIFLSDDGQRFNLFFLCFVPVLWAVLRHGFVGAALTAIAIDILGLSAILHSGVPGGMEDAPVALRYFQLFAVTLAVVAYTLGITVDRLKQARSTLDRQSRDLEDQVERRTRQLALEIEERKRAEEQLRRLNDSLEQRVLARTEALNDARMRAERANEAKTQFLQNMSHELRTPLNAVIGFAQILHDEIMGPLGHEKYRDYARDIVASGNHLLTLVGDLLEMASLTGEDPPLRLERCSLNETIQTVRVMTEAKAASRGVALGIYGAEPDILLMSDRARLIQILVNLMSNAIKFAPADGGKVELRATRDGADAVIEVRDNGPGIPPEDLPHVFDRFWRGSRSDLTGSGGMGLGLAIARSLAERHGGTLMIECPPEGGTRAMLRLPLLVEMDASPERAAPQRAALP